MKKTDIYDAFLKLKKKEDVKKFIRDLCTIKEIKAMEERWAIAQMVNEKIPYRKVSEETGASTATVTRVAQWLRGGEGGYKLVLEQLSA